MEKCLPWSVCGVATGSLLVSRAAAGAGVAGGARGPGMPSLSASSEAGSGSESSASGVPSESESAVPLSMLSGVPSESASPVPSSNSDRCRALATRSAPSQGPRDVRAGRRARNCSMTLDERRRTDRATRPRLGIHAGRDWSPHATATPHGGSEALLDVRLQLRLPALEPVDELAPVSTLRL